MTTTANNFLLPSETGASDDGLLRGPPHSGDRLGRHDAPSVVPRRYPFHQALHTQEQMANQARRDVHVLVQFAPAAVLGHHRRNHSRHYIASRNYNFV